jgi:hypothetical protein
MPASSSVWNDSSQLFGMGKSQVVSLEIRYLRLVNQFLPAHALEVRYPSSCVYKEVNRACRSVAACRAL